MVLPCLASLDSHNDGSQEEKHLVLQMGKLRLGTT